MDHATLRWLCFCIRAQFRRSVQRGQGIWKKLYTVLSFFITKRYKYGECSLIGTLQPGNSLRQFPSWQFHQSNTLNDSVIISMEDTKTRCSYQKVFKCDRRTEPKIFPAPLINNPHQKATALKPDVAICGRCAVGSVFSACDVHSCTSLHLRSMIDVYK